MITGSPAAFNGLRHEVKALRREAARLEEHSAKQKEIDWCSELRFLRTLTQLGERLTALINDNTDANLLETEEEEI